MRQLRVLRVLIVIAALVGAASAATAAAPRTPASQPEYTWTLAALGQGAWIGGPLFDDGTVGGGGALTIQNGRIVARLLPTTWTEDADEMITVCFDVILKKGPAGSLPPSICIGPAEVTGTPIHLPLFGDDHIFRITETGR